MTVIMCFFHLFPVVDNHHRRERRGPGSVPVSVREPQPPAYETNFRFPVNVIVKIRRVCSRRNKQNNRIPPPALPRKPFEPTCRSRVRKADCRIPRRRDPSFAKVRPFPACSTIRISLSYRSLPHQERSRTRHSACQISLAAYTSTYFLKKATHPDSSRSLPLPFRDIHQICTSLLYRHRCNKS